VDKKPYKIEYHCFGDNWDEYFDTEKKARLYISERIKDGDRNLRIYTDTYDTKEDYDNGNRYEEGIYFLGDFPK
jgi:hypothetical protein